MKIIIKGIIDKRKLKTHMLIIFFLLFMFSILSLIIGYQNKVNEVLTMKEEYRTVSLKIKEEDLVIIKKYESVIEDLNTENDKNSDIQNITILFQNHEALSKFLKENTKLKSRATLQLYNDENTTAMTTFKVMFYLTSVIIFVLLLIFSVDYFHSLKKDIALFKILGFNKIKIIISIYLILITMYLILFVISYLLSYSLYFLFIKRLSFCYYSIFKIDFKIPILIILVEMISLLIDIKSDKTSNELTLLSSF